MILTPGATVSLSKIEICGRVASSLISVVSSGILARSISLLFACAPWVKAIVLIVTGGFVTEDEWLIDINNWLFFLYLRWLITQLTTIDLIRSIITFGITITICCTFCIIVLTRFFSLWTCKIIYLEWEKASSNKRVKQ